MKIRYVEKNFRPETLDRIELANGIIDEYRAAGYVLTVRQLYYQFVARDLIANNTQEYNRLKSFVSDGRLAGLIDWDAIEDRTRSGRARGGSGRASGRSSPGASGTSGGSRRKKNPTGAS